MATITVPAYKETQLTTEKCKQKKSCNGPIFVMNEHKKKETIRNSKHKLQ